jgi:exonuclease VII large subunit
MRKQRRRGSTPRPSIAITLVVPDRKKWAEMTHAERKAWIDEKRTWLTEKRQREQEYLDWRNADLETDRAYRADAPHELDLLAMLAELADEADEGGKRERGEE